FVGGQTRCELFLMIAHRAKHRLQRLLPGVGDQELMLTAVDARALLADPASRVQLVDDGRRRRAIHVEDLAQLDLRKAGVGLDQHQHRELGRRRLRIDHVLVEQAKVQHLRAADMEAEEVLQNPQTDPPTIVRNLLRGSGGRAPHRSSPSDKEKADRLRQREALPQHERTATRVRRRRFSLLLLQPTRAGTASPPEIEGHPAARAPGVAARRSAFEPHESTVECEGHLATARTTRSTRQAEIADRVLPTNAPSAAASISITSQRRSKASSTAPTGPPQG